MSTSIWFWVAFHAGVFLAIVVDLAQFKRRDRALSMRAATHRIVIWIVLSLLFNLLYNQTLSDIETCYKMFRREVIQSIPIEENRFGFEPEITVKVARRKLRIYEVGVSYWGRTYEEGKKIGLKDAFSALYCIVRYKWFD